MAVETIHILKITEGRELPRGKMLGSGSAHKAMRKILDRFGQVERRKGFVMAAVEAARKYAQRLEILPHVIESTRCIYVHSQRIRAVTITCFCDKCQSLPLSVCTWCKCFSKGFRSKGSSWFCDTCKHFYDWRAGSRIMPHYSCLPSPAPFSILLRDSFIRISVVQ